MFGSVQAAPPDPILGLTEAFVADPREGKINLGVGIYKDAAGKTPVLGCVKEAERRILAAEATKAYKPMAGDPAYGKLIRVLLFGEGHTLIESGRAVTAHTPSGTGALRVVGDYLKQNHPDATLWLPSPTWANHAAVFGAAGVPTKTYAYANAAVTGLDIDAMVEAVGRVPAGDVVLMHGCCHNPTGIDPTAEQWGRIAAAVAAGGATPMLDFAYQGFADGVREDAVGLSKLAETCDELIVCTSFSKNISLYNERVGSVTFVAKTADEAKAVFSNVKLAIRKNYSNPPAHGGEIVKTILGDAALTAQWHEELADMRNRINGMRALFADTMAAKGSSIDFGFMKSHRGMFSMTGLSKEQVGELREKHAIYIVGSGRVNVAGMTETNMGVLTDAIAGVL